MRRKFNFLTCELRFDMHYHGVKPCYGAITVVAGVNLCERHLSILEAIRRDAEEAGTIGRPLAHPVHRSRSAA